MDLGKRYVVYSVRKGEHNHAAVWIRAGYAVANPDGSTNVVLDVLPLDGKLHIREAVEKREHAAPAAGPQQQRPAVQQPQQQLGAQSLQLVEMQSMGGH